MKKAKLISAVVVVSAILGVGGARAADLPMKAISNQVAAALDLVVHLERLADGVTGVLVDGNDALAVYAVREERYAQALDAYKHAIELRPSDPTNYIGKWHLMPAEGLPREQARGWVPPQHRGGIFRAHNP